MRMVYVAVLFVVSLHVAGCVSMQERFIEAVEQGDVDRIERMLSKRPGLAKDTTKQGYDVPVIAVVGDSTIDADKAVRTAELLMQHGADPADVKWNDRPSFVGTRHGAVFDLLLRRVTRQDAIDMALIYQQIELMQSIEEATYWPRYGRFFDFQPNTTNQRTWADELVELRRRIDALQARGAGSTGRWPQPIVSAAREPELPGSFSRSSEWMWYEHDGESMLLRIFGGGHGDVRVYAFDRSLHLRRQGQAVSYGMATHIVLVRGDDDRLPERVKGQWLLGIASGGTFTVAQDPIGLGGQAIREPTLTMGAAPIDAQLVAVIDWFGDDTDLRGLPLAPCEWRNVEFRIVSTKP